MEILLQYLDDLDDLCATIGLLAESFRRLLIVVLFLTAAISLQFVGILLALRRPPVALATALLLGMVLLYRTVTTRAPGHDSIA